MHTSNRGTGAALLVMLAVVSSAGAEPPALRTMFPPGLQRDVQTKVQLTGQRFAPGMELILPFAADVRQGAASAEQASFVIRPKQTPTGVYPVRVRTAAGVSNMLLLSVDDLPRVEEREPNGRRMEAQHFNGPAVITGTLGGRAAPHPSKDLDIYRFSVKAGQRLTFVGETRRVGLAPDLFLCVRDANGRALASCDDVPGLGVDPRLDYTFKEAGDYTIEVHLSYFEYTGRNLVYQVKVGPFDYARSVFPLGGQRGQKLQVAVSNRDGKTSTIEAEVPADAGADEWRLPLHGFAGSLPWRMAVGDLPEIVEAPRRSDAQTIPWPVTVNGRIDAPGEIDRYRLAVKPGQKVDVRVEAFHHGSALSGRLRVLEVSGRLLAEDHARLRSTMDPRASFTVPEGAEAVIVTLEDCFQRGGIDCPYRLIVEPGGPDFELFTGPDFPPSGWPENDALNLVVDQPLKLRVKAQRRGYAGPIDLKLVDAPAGVSTLSTVVAEGQTTGELILTASSQAPAALFDIGIVGEAQIEGRLVRRKVVRPIHLAEPYFTNLPWNWRLTRLTCVRVGARDD